MRRISERGSGLASKIKRLVLSNPAYRPGISSVVVPTRMYKQLTQADPGFQPSSKVALVGGMVFEDGGALEIIAVRHPSSTAPIFSLAAKRVGPTRRGGRP